MISNKKLPKFKLFSLADMSTILSNKPISSSLIYKLIKINNDHYKSHIIKVNT